MADPLSTEAHRSVKRYARIRTPGAAPRREQGHVVTCGGDFSRRVINLVERLQDAPPKATGPRR